MTQTSTEESFDHEIKSKRCFCRVHEIKRIRWDLFIMLFAIWNSIQIPYSIAFMPNQDQGVYNTIINLIVDSFFIADIFINFRTSIMDDEKGTEISSEREIFWSYIKGKLIQN